MPQVYLTVAVPPGEKETVPLEPVHGSGLLAVTVVEWPAASVPLPEAETPAALVTDQCTTPPCAVIVMVQVDSVAPMLQPPTDSVPVGVGVWVGRCVGRCVGVGRWVVG